MKTLLCFWVLAALAGVAFADSNVTGKWTGSFNMTGPNGETKETTALLLLTQSATDITGTEVTNEHERIIIHKGQIEDDEINLEAEAAAHTITFGLVRA